MSIIDKLFIISYNRRVETKTLLNKLETAMSVSSLKQFRKLLKASNSTHFTPKAIEVLYEYMKDCKCEGYDPETDSYPIEGYDLQEWEQVNMTEEARDKLNAQYGGCLPSAEVYKGTWVIRAC